MDSYAVFGHPINHSRSPFIHQRFAAQTEQALKYRAIEAPLDDFAKTVEAFFQGDGKGANVTVPFKEQAFALCTEVSERASRAGAVNTLVKTANGEIHGDNTDGIGLVTDLLNKQVTLSNSRILLLGAGGAARGVILPLLAQQPASIVISNRTVSKAQALVELFDHSALSASDLTQLDNYQFDLIINATSAGLSGNMPSLSSKCLHDDTVCYDMVYMKGQTPFNQWASQNGVKQCFDGLGMLVEQAAESFFIWRGVKPNTQMILSELRTML